MSNRVSFIIQFRDKFSRTSQKLKDQFAGIERQADKTTRSISEMAKKAQLSLGSMGRRATVVGGTMTAALTLPIGLLGKSMIKAASDAEEISSKFRDIFGDSKLAGEAVSGLSTEFKLATSTAQDMLAQTGAMLSATGMQKDQVIALSKSINAASIDLASMHNFQGSAAESSMILTKALLGEAESLKTNFGITVQQNREFQQAVKLRMRMKGMTQAAAKAEVIYGMIMRQAGEEGQNAIGNFARTQHEYANQVRIATEESIRMKEAFGKLLLPTATKVIGVITKMTNWVNELSPAWKKLVIVLAGLVAIAGPLLLLLGGIALAVSVISLPVLAIAAAVLAVGAAIAYVAWQWDSIVSGMQEKWEAFKTSLGGMGQKFMSFFGMGGSAPSAPRGGAANSTLNGEITVSAAPGAKVESTKLKTQGSGLNLGMNMAGAY